MMKISNNFIIKKIENGIVLINTTKNKEIYSFNQIGKIIVENIDKEKEEIIKIICNNYAISQDKVFSDYDKFINQLLEEGILVDCDRD